MTTYKYSTQKYNPEHMAKAVGYSLPISFKHSVEICKHLRYKDLAKAKNFLKQVIGIKLPVPFTRFNRKVAHKKNSGPGRYPTKACNEILRLLDSVEANAQFKGLSTGSLRISHFSAQKASSPMHYGRQRGVQMKRTHVEVVVEEMVAEKNKAKIKTKTAIEDSKKNEKSFSETQEIKKEIPAEKEAAIQKKQKKEKLSEKKPVLKKEAEKEQNNDENAQKENQQVNKE